MLEILPKQISLPPRHRYSTNKRITTKKSLGRKMLMDGYLVIVVKESNGSYSGRCVEFPGAITQGDTLPELRNNMKEAISLIRESYLEEAEQIIKDTQPKGRIITVKP